jgi:hypothetical protein
LVLLPGIGNTEGCHALGIKPGDRLDVCATASGGVYIVKAGTKDD